MLEPTPAPRPATRESELAIACCESTVNCGGMVRPCWPDNSIGGDRFRLRWSNQEKRAEGCGCDLVNPVTVNQYLPIHRRIASPSPPKAS